MDIEGREMVWYDIRKYVRARADMSLERHMEDECRLGSEWKKKAKV